MKKANRYFVAAALLLALSALLLCLSSCGGLSVPGHIEDTNGDSTELCQLTNEDVLRKNPSEVMLGSVSSQLNREYSFKVTKLSGVHSVGKFNAKGELLTINVSSTLESGNARIVLLHNGEIYTDVTVGVDQKIEIEDPSGTYDLRVAGESAKLEVKMDYSLTE